MKSEPRIKFCGLSRTADVDAAVSAGAAYVGFVFFPRSPRHLNVAEAAVLAGSVPAGIAKVALTVDADDAALDTLLASVPVDVLQLHGKESPERVAQVRALSGLPVMKAVGIATQDDLPKIADYSNVADMLLVDAKPPPDAALPGGNGLAFDWRLVAGRRWSVPWMLAGGLNPDNVAEALRLTGAEQVDVSSGIESSPGQKDPVLIARFAAAAQAASASVIGG